MNKVVLILAGALMLSGCGSDDKEQDLAKWMSPTEDGNYVLLFSPSVKGPEVAYRVIKGGKVVADVEAKWIGEVPGIGGTPDFLTKASCGEIFLSSMNGKMFVDALPESGRRVGYERCGLSDIQPLSWQIRVDKRT